MFHMKILPFFSFHIFYLQLNQKRFHVNSNVRSVATGSYGCGSSHLGDAQFKLIIQWLAASVANVPILIYYTCSNENLSKLDTVVRVLHGESIIVCDGIPMIKWFYLQFVQIASGQWASCSDILFSTPKIFSTIQPPATIRISLSLTNSSDWNGAIDEWYFCLYLHFLSASIKSKILKTHKKEIQPTYTYFIYTSIHKYKDEIIFLTVNSIRVEKIWKLFLHHVENFITLSSNFDEMRKCSSF